MLKLLKDEKIDLNLLRQLSSRPHIFERGNREFWTDDHISLELLKAHLDPVEDMASRKHHDIKESCQWLAERLDLDENSKVIDLGCGPGLYCKELASSGINMTGVDFSERSIDHAKANDSSRYVMGDYLTLEFNDTYDAALMIYYDFDVLSDSDREKMLRKVYHLLNPGGFFVFDVLTPTHEEAGTETSHWKVYERGGFWHPGIYLELYQRYYYGDEHVKLDQHIIIDQEGNTSLYRIWHRFFTLTRITNLLRKHGFIVEDFFSDLKGNAYEIGSGSIGIIARKG